MNMTTYHKTRLPGSDDLQDCCAAQAAALAASIEHASRRRVTHQDTTGRARFQQSSGLIFGEVVAPGPEGSHGNATAQAEEGHTRNLHARPMENMGGMPIAARLFQLFVTFVVAGHKHCGDRRLTKEGDGNIQAPSEVGKIACADQYVRLSRTAYDTADRLDVCVDVAKAKQFHGSGQTSWRVQCGKVLHLLEDCC